MIYYSYPSSSKLAGTIRYLILYLIICTNSDIFYWYDWEYVRFWTVNLSISFKLSVKLIRYLYLLN